MNRFHSITIYYQREKYKLGTFFLNTLFYNILYASGITSAIIASPPFFCLDYD